MTGQLQHRVAIVIFVCIIIIFSVSWFFANENTRVSELKKNYKIFRNSEDYFRNQLTLSLTNSAPSVSVLSPNTVHIYSDTINYKHVLYLFLTYPTIHYVLSYPSELDLDMIRHVGDSFVSFLYDSKTELFDPSFIIAQRSKFTMQLLFSKAFYEESTSLETLFLQYVESTRLAELPFIRTYFSFIFIDTLEIPTPKYTIQNRLLDHTIDNHNIFQTWVSHDTDVEYLYHSSESIKRDYPNYSYRLFDDYDMKTFIMQFYPQTILDRYDAILPSAFKSDFFRYLYLYKFGGLYFDITLLSKRPITDFIDLDDYDFIVPTDVGTKINQLYQAFMYVKKGHPYMKACIDRIVNYDFKKMKEIKHCLDYTGPKLLGSVVDSALENNKHSNNLFLRHLDGNSIVFDKYTNERHVILYTKGNFPKLGIASSMYRESQKYHYSKHCTMNAIFYNELI